MLPPGAQGAHQLLATAELLVIGVGLGDAPGCRTAPYLVAQHKHEHGRAGLGAPQGTAAQQEQLPGPAPPAQGCMALGSDKRQQQGRLSGPWAASTCPATGPHGLAAHSAPAPAGSPPLSFESQGMGGPNDDGALGHCNLECMPRGVLGTKNNTSGCATGVGGEGPSRRTSQLMHGPVDGRAGALLEGGFVDGQAGALPEGESFGPTHPKEDAPLPRKMQVSEIAAGWWHSLLLAEEAGSLSTTIRPT